MSTSLTVLRVRECFELIHSFIHSANTGDGEDHLPHFVPCSILGAMGIAVNQKKTPCPLRSYIRLEFKTKILDMY